MCVYRWGWDVGGEKDKDKKKEVRERERNGTHLEQMKDRRGKKNPQLFPKKKDFLLLSLKNILPSWTMALTKLSFPRAKIQTVLQE